MNHKTLVGSIALLLILVVLASGCGKSITTSTSVIIPSHAGSPIISMDINHLMRGERSKLAVYEDGYIIRTEEKGLRLPVYQSEHTPTRSWYTIQLEKEELTGLVDFFQNSGFMDMNQMYVFVGEPTDNGGKSFGDNFVTIIISYGDLQKSVNASAYLTYADMPFPLNEIYDRLWDIALEASFILSEIIPN